MSDDELIELIGRCIWPHDMNGRTPTDAPERIVAALAGRLLPPVVDSRREWRIVSTENTQLDEGFQFETVYQDEIETVDEAIAALREWREEYGRTDARMQFHDITHVSGGGIYYAPWCEVSP